MRRTRWLVIFLVGLGATGWAAAKDEKVKEGIQLPATDSYYFLDVPEGADAKESLPLVVLAQNAPGQAKQTFDTWVPRLKADHILVACLNVPQGALDQTEFRIPRMVEEIHKKYEVDTRRMVLVGAGAAAQDVMKFVAAHPDYFAKAIALSPNGFPDLPKKFSGGRRTELIVTMPKPPAKGKEAPKTEKRDKDTIKAEKDAAAKEKQENKKIAVCLETLRSRVKFTGKQGEGFGVGGVSDKEKDIAIDTIRTCYSDAKRAQIAAALKPAEGEKTPKEEKEEKKGKESPKKPKTEEGTTEPAQKTETGKEATQAPVEAKSADELLEEANKLEQDQKYGPALRVYERLAKLKPGSDYERVALKKAEELRKNPLVRQSLADEAADKAAGGEPKRWLSAGRNFVGSKMPDKAAAEFKKIISKYPDTSYATEARKELEHLDAEK